MNVQMSSGTLGPLCPKGDQQGGAECWFSLYSVPKWPITGLIYPLLFQRNITVSICLCRYFSYILSLGSRTNLKKKACKLRFVFNLTLYLPLVSRHIKLIKIRLIELPKIHIWMCKWLQIDSLYKINNYQCGNKIKNSHILFYSILRMLKKTILSFWFFSHYQFCL